MSLESVIPPQQDQAATCKCSLILKKRLRRLIALSCLFLLCPSEIQHSWERQWCKRLELAVLEGTSAFGSNDTAGILCPLGHCQVSLSLYGGHTELAEFYYEKLNYPSCRGPDALCKLLLHVE